MACARAEPWVSCRAGQALVQRSGFRCSRVGSVRVLVHFLHAHSGGIAELGCAVVCGPARRLRSGVSWR
jgi:hypothetical protein